MSSRLLLLFGCCILLAQASGQVITTIAGTGTPGYSGDGGPAVQARLSSPNAICLDRHGNLFFSDWFNRVIRRISPSEPSAQLQAMGLRVTAATVVLRSRQDYTHPTTLNLTQQAICTSLNTAAT